MKLYVIFLKVLNMSLTASIMILFVMLGRLLLKKAPKIYSYALWAVVLFRLLCPLSISAPFSMLALFPASAVDSTGIMSEVEYVPTDYVDTEYQEAAFSAKNIPNAGNEILHQEKERLTVDLQKPSGSFFSFAAFVWVFGITVILSCSAVSYGRLQRRLVGALHLHDNIYMADDISSPFVMGLFFPKIYLPSFMEEQEYIILHEKYHIRRLDHIFKVLAFIALCVHWFNPFVWAAFMLFVKDMEMSCDEAVIKKMGAEVRADYCAALLSLGTGQKMMPGTPLAFGEGDTKGRIKNLAGWKRPGIWMTTAAVLLCAIIISMCVLNPEKPEEKTASKPEQSKQQFIEEELPEEVAADSAAKLEAAITSAILDFDKEKYSEESFVCESHVILDTEVGNVPSSKEREGQVPYITVYAMVLKQSYDLSSGAIVDEGGSHIPTAITFEVNEAGEYTLAEYWMPMDGSRYIPTIREKFPDDIADEAIDTQKYILMQIQSCYQQAVEYGSLDTDGIVERLLDEIISAPEVRAESGISPYIENKSIEYRELTYYGFYTLKYCFQEFLNGGQTDLRGLLMATVCQEIMKGFGEDFVADGQFANGQEWFDEFYSNPKGLTYLEKLGII